MQSLIINYPCDLTMPKEVETTEIERKWAYDIIMTAFEYHYTFMVQRQKGFIVGDKNLSDFRIYRKLLDMVDEHINDAVTRDFVINTLKAIKSNRYTTNVLNTYKTISYWFYPQNYRGQVFRNNILKNKPLKIINFKDIFENCENTPITENMPAFLEIKQLFNNYQNQVENFI